MNNARDLTLRLAELLSREQSALADFLLALADFDRRRAWLDLGYSSLFYFLHRELGLSKGAAHYRKTAAELVQRFPEVVEPLRDGRLCITSVVELAKVITPENRAEVLPRFFHRSRREAKEVAVELRPRAAPHREVVTVVQPVEPVTEACAVQPVEPAPPADRVPPLQALQASSTAAQTAPAVANESSRGPSAAPRARRDDAEPLTADLRRLHVTVSRRFLEKLEAARAALSHARPGAGAEEILEAGLDLLLAQQARKRGCVERPRREQRSAKPDHVPAHVKRAVWARDEGKCQWPLASGGTCGSTLRLELDHVIPKARGGPSTVENVRLLCDFHNDLAARRAFGDHWMDRFTGGRGRVRRRGTGLDSLERPTTA